MGLQGAPPTPLALLEGGKRDVPLRSLEGERATKWRGGCWREKIEKRLKAEQAAKAAYKLIAPGRYHHPLNPPNPHASQGVSNGADTTLSGKAVIAP